MIGRPAADLYKRALFKKLAVDLRHGTRNSSGDRRAHNPSLMAGELTQLQIATERNHLLRPA
jgi:hypothetical protein